MADSKVSIIIPHHNNFDILNHFCSSYLRIEVKDQSGVLLSITKSFAQNKISIKNLIQKPNKKNKKASIIIITHENIEKKVVQKYLRTQIKSFLLTQRYVLRDDIDQHPQHPSKFQA